MPILYGPLYVLLCFSILSSIFLALSISPFILVINSQHELHKDVALLLVGLEHISHIPLLGSEEFILVDLILIHLGRLSLP